MEILKLFVVYLPLFCIAFALIGIIIRHSSFCIRHSKTLILDVARFGPRMTWEEVQTALRARREDDLFRAVAQLLEYQRQRCQLAVQDKSNLPAGQMAFEAGAAASAADVMAMLAEIADQKCADRELASWFGGQIRAKQE